MIVLFMEPQVILLNSYLALWNGIVLLWLMIFAVTFEPRESTNSILM